MTLPEKEKTAAGKSEKIQNVRSEEPAKGAAERSMGAPAASPTETATEDDGLADIPPFTLSLDPVEEHKEPESAMNRTISGVPEETVQAQPVSETQNANDVATSSAASSTSAQDIPASDFLYDAQGNPQMRILYDSKGNPVYVPLQK